MRPRLPADLGAKAGREKHTEVARDAINLRPKLAADF
jgi:hypothetical protein